MLQRAGAEVVAVADAPQALAAIGARAPNVIVCDMGLPGEDGCALIEKVRALERPVSRVPAVAFTAWGQPQDRGRAEKAGFQAHLLKPVEPRALVETVARVAGRADDQGPASTRS